MGWKLRTITKRISLSVDRGKFSWQRSCLRVTLAPAQEPLHTELSAALYRRCLGNGWEGWGDTSYFLGIIPLTQDHNEWKTRVNSSTLDSGIVFKQTLAANFCFSPLKEESQDVAVMQGGMNNAAFSFC